MLHITPKTLVAWEKTGRVPLPERDWRGWRLYDEAFVSVAEAQTCLETHQHWYNEGRPHSSLHYVSPATFARSWRQEQQRQGAIESPV